MIEYDDKDWWTSLFSLHQGDTARQLAPLLFTMLMYTTGVAWIVIHYLGLSQHSYGSHVSVVHSLLGFAISLVLVFRTNSAYDRWWEGRRQWGALVNNTRNLALKLDALLPADAREDRAFFRRMIPNFAFALKNHLRGEVKLADWEEVPAIPTHTVLVDRNIPAFVSREIFRRLHALQQRGVLTELQLLLVNAEVQSLMDIAGACERILKTPIPYAYSSFLKKFIVLYCITLPFGYVVSLHYWIVPVVTFVFYVMASLELIAEEIEEPFGKDPNDLPTETISLGIRKVVGELLV